MGIKVTLRKKSISNQRYSLFLDYYPAILNSKNKLSRREHLKMYIFKRARSPVDKKHNADTLLIAEQIRQNKDNQINKPEVYTEYERALLRSKELGQQSFIEYFKRLADKRKNSNHDNWISCYNYLVAFTNENLRFDEISEKFCNDFKEYLLTRQSIKSTKVTLAQNSALSYFNKFKAALKQAYNDEYFQANINMKIKSIKAAETHRNFLSYEELNLLAKTPCENPLLKNAALFSALTGFRFSDIVKLKWSEILFIENDGYYIKFRQQKTGGTEMMPVSIQAHQLLGERKEDSKNVFPTINDRDRYYYFPMWAAKAGIKRRITFHCLRHTYATLQLSRGADIYTVSKLLGHRDLKTTQIYAKVIDKVKRQATENIKIDI
jgi:integrase